jgi:signal transduction histidine kinase
VLIRKREIEKLSSDIRRIIDGQDIEIRDNCEGAWGILKNDIHTLASIKNAQADSFQLERDSLADTLANISHQLKTPLTSMMIMADLLDTAPPEKQAVFIENIKTELTNMEWLVSSLLKMAKFDAGAIELSPEKIQAGTLVKLALTPLQILLDIKAQHVMLTKDIELFCDKRWTAEALTNIIKNASDYSGNGGMIHIKVGTNPICRWISVTDSGDGISNAEISNLFKRFACSRSDNGYGIGLPLALSIIRGQNGDIEVDGGGNGCGATFTLKLYK